LLLPYVPHTLDDDIVGKRRLLADTLESKRKPYSEREALSIFLGVVRGVAAVHAAGFSHRDIRPSNVGLLAAVFENGKGDGEEDVRGSSNNRRDNDGKKAGKNKKRQRGCCTRRTRTPVLMDFGSAGPLAVSVRSPEELSTARVEIARHTTESYRAPELHALITSAGASDERSSSSSSSSSAVVIRYDHADVYSLGCTLFAMLYGASPVEIRWCASLVEGHAADGTARVVSPTENDHGDWLVVEERSDSDDSSDEYPPVPFPPSGSAADERGYGDGIRNFIRSMLDRDPSMRPTCNELIEKVSLMLCGGGPQ